MSRKLIFVSGLLACFSFHLLLNPDEQARILSSSDRAHEFVRHMRVVLSQSPLEILAAVLNRHRHLLDLGAGLFDGYDEFLGVLSNNEDRQHLNNLPPGAESTDPLFQRLREASHKFRDSLLDLFFDDDSGLAKLTRTYGVF